MISLTRLWHAAVLASAVSLTALVGDAAEPDGLRPEIRREAEKMRKVLEQNFRACNEENIKALMATISPTMPGIADFHNESKRMFAETDVYLSLDSFELIAYRPPFGVARVVQVTLPRDEKDREAGPELQQAYRSDTALLPQWERAVYTQQFKKEAGKWRLHGILETPSPVNE